MTSTLPSLAHEQRKVHADRVTPPATLHFAGISVKAVLPLPPADRICLAQKLSGGTIFVRKGVCLALLLYAVLISSTSATIITFDDLYVSGGIPVSNPYNGLLWTNFYPAATNWFNTPNGFVNACISGEDFADNGGGGTATISSALFNLTGGYFAAGWRDNLQLQVEGFLKGSLLYSNTYLLDAASGTMLNFNYQGVDTVVFSASGGTQHTGYLGDGTFFAMDNLDVTVIDDALINTQPVARTAIAGDSVSFSVSAYGAPPFTYQWFFNGSSIDAATNESLTLTNVQSYNQGEYKVVVSGLHNSVSSSNATLAITASPPRIIAQPTMQVDAATFNVTLSAFIMGSLPIYYQWQFNGTNINGATNTLFALTTPQSTNDGYYDLIASNAYGSVTSSIVVLDVNSLSAILAWGNDAYGLTNVPSGLSNVKAIASGYVHVLALKGDGTVVAWGDDSSGQTNVPAGLNNVASIAAGGGADVWHS